MRISDWSSDWCSSDLSMLSDIAQHRIDALQHHQFLSIGRKTAEALVQVLHAIVPEPHDLRIAQCAAIINGRMAIGIQHDIVALARKRGDHAQIGLIAGRKDHGMIHAVKVLERVLTFPMALISAVENAAARRSRSEMVERILGTLYHIEI